MASIRVIVTDGDVRVVAEGNLNQGTKVAEAACEALTAWRACSANPPVASTT